MAGERAAVLRAVIVASVFLAGELLEREPDLPNALSLAALILLVLNPLVMQRLLQGDRPKRRRG